MAKCVPFFLCVVFVVRVLSKDIFISMLPIKSMHNFLIIFMSIFDRSLTQGFVENYFMVLNFLHFSFALFFILNVVHMGL